MWWFLWDYWWVWWYELGGDFGGGVEIKGWFGGDWGDGGKVVGWDGKIGVGDFEFDEWWDVLWDGVGSYELY